MNQLAASELAALARLEVAPCISIFQPRVGRGRADRQDGVRFENLAREAERRLRERGIPEEEVEGLLRPVIGLAADPAIWTGGAGGVAFFAGAGFARSVEVDFDLPERVAVGGRFVVRPLLPLLDRPQHFWVLALSLNRVRLLRGEPGGGAPFALPGLPVGFDEEMGYTQFESAVSGHSSSPAALGRRSLVFHGHGDGDEEHLKDDVRHFLGRVVAALEARLPEPEAPMVVAAVAEHLTVLRDLSRRLALLDPGLPGNPDALADGELLDRARERVVEASNRRVAKELESWRALRASGRAAESLEEVVRAAAEGRVESLFVAREAERWGRFEPERDRLLLHELRQPGDYELLEQAAARTLAAGGRAHVLPQERMPEGRAAVALLRWSAAA